MSCSHPLDAEYLYPADAEVLGIEASDDRVLFRIVLPCPECDQSLEVEAPVSTVTETALELPLEGSTDQYD